MRSVVRALLPVAVLLLGLQLAAAGRTLQQTPKSVPVALTRQQFVQATFGLKGVTCDQVSAILNDPFVNNTFSRAVIADFQTQLIKDGWPAAAAVVVAVRQPCLTSNIDGENYASYRTMIRFNSTNSTSTRDTMFAGLSTAVARPCTGGYNRGLYRAVTALFAQLPFNVSQNNGNRQNVFFPNGPGPTGFGDNWIDYASPAMSYCDYLRSPSPSPSPSPEAPSPSPEAPSPSPETPSPSPELCPANATRDESGACVCDAGFTSALNGTTVIACLNSTGLTSCPASAPVAVKPVDDPAPMIMSCITQDTPCPAGFTLALYSGNPSVRQECRPNNGGCNYAGFGIQVTTADNTLIGCANSTSNACPFVAYRSAPTFAVDKCVQVTSCPAYSVPSSVLHTVPALEVGSSVPVACLTLDTTTNTCPDLPALRYPLEVVFASGSVNPCGSTAQPCIAAATRTIECRTANATCPAAQSLRLYGGSGATPVVVECRQTRSSCDLTAVGMTDKTPNAGSYNIAVRTGDALDGCIIAGATTCPAGYPYPTRDNNALVSCTPTVPAVQCTGTQVPLLNANGTTAACQSNNLACPTTFPITLRTESSGNVAGCSALTSTCPTAYPFPLYSKFTSVPGVDASATVLTNCWQAGFISTCSTVFFADDSQPAGIGGRYNVPIVTNTTGTEQLLGCVLQGSATCPSAYPFTLYAPVDGAPPAAAKCYPAGEVQACGGSYPIPGYTQSQLTACIGRPATPVAVDADACPAAYPVISVNSLEPTAAATTTDLVTRCSTQGTPCSANSAQPFSLVEKAAPNTVVCVPQINGITTCTDYPDTKYNGLPIFSANGLALIGCTEDGATACPAPFPIFFKAQPADVVMRCQGSLAGTCASVASGLYPITIGGPNNTVAGCQTTAETCAGGIPLRATAEGSIQGCIPASQPCPATYPTALYDSVVVPVMCLSATATNCNDGGIFYTYNVEVYGNAGGTGNVVGCMKSNVDTRCPGTTLPLMTQVVTGDVISFAITQCRAGPVACPITVDGVAYSAPLTTSNGLSTEGCLAASATTCPLAAYATGPVSAASPYNYPFFLLSSAGTVQQCRAPIVAASTAGQCTATVGSSYPVEVPRIGAPGDLAGCQAAAPLTGCPAGYIAIYSNSNNVATITSCIPDATCTGDTSWTVYNSLAVRIGCTAAGTGVAVCTSLFSTADYISVRTASAAAGCMAPSAPSCPSTNSFAIYEAATGIIPALKICTSATPTCGETGAAVSPIPIYNVFAVGTSGRVVVGCTAGGTGGSPVAPIRCPSRAPFFSATAGGVLDTAGSFAAFCSEAGPVADCPTAAVEVRDTTVAGSNAPVVGCLGATASFAETTSCPATVPAAGTFAFPIVIGQDFLGATEGNIVECIRPGNAVAACSGASIVPFGANTVPVLGCVSRVADACPDAGWISKRIPAVGGGDPTGYTFNLYAQTLPTDATPKPAGCIAQPTSCPTGYPVAVSTDTLGDTLTSDNLKACAAADTACPDTYFPLINGTLKVTACRLASACPANYIPLCDQTAAGKTIAATTGVCTDAANTQGCIAAAAAATATGWQVCQRLASTGTLAKYPSSIASASQYKFAVSLEAVGSPVVSCGIYTTTAEACLAAGTTEGDFTIETYPLSVTPPGPSFQGCTNGGATAVNACTSWWGSVSSPPGGFCDAGA